MKQIKYRNWIESEEGQETFLLARMIGEILFEEKCFN